MKGRAGNPHPLVGTVHGEFNLQPSCLPPPGARAARPDPKLSSNLSPGAPGLPPEGSSEPVLTLGEEEEVQTGPQSPRPPFFTFPASSSSLSPSFLLSFLLFCPDSIRTQQET